MTSFRTRLERAPLIAILRGITPDEVDAVGAALIEATFEIIEVPLNSPAPLDSIRALRQTYPEALVGAGTVLTPDDVNAVWAAGGQLVVSPNCNPLVIRTAVDLGMVCLPGIASPTEAFAALDAGAQGLKVFPAEMVPPAAITTGTTRAAYLQHVSANSLCRWAQCSARGLAFFGTTRRRQRSSWATRGRCCQPRSREAGSLLCPVARTY